MIRLLRALAWREPAPPRRTNNWDRVMIERHLKTVDFVLLQALERGNAYAERLDAIDGEKRPTFHTAEEWIQYLQEAKLLKRRDVEW